MNVSLFFAVSFSLLSVAPAVAADEPKEVVCYCSIYDRDETYERDGHTFEGDYHDLGAIYFMATRANYKALSTQVCIKRAREELDQDGFDFSKPLVGSCSFTKKRMRF